MKRGRVGRVGGEVGGELIPVANLRLGLALSVNGLDGPAAPNPFLTHYPVPRRQAVFAVCGN